MVVVVVRLFVVEEKVRNKWVALDRVWWLLKCWHCKRTCDVSDQHNINIIRFLVSETTCGEQVDEGEQAEEVNEAETSRRRRIKEFTEQKPKLFG